METRFESFNDFKPTYEKMPIGTHYWKVKTFDGNTGNCVSIEYTTDEDDLGDMREVPDGYFTETYKCTKKQPVQS